MPAVLSPAHRMSQCSRILDEMPPADSAPIIAVKDKSQHAVILDKTISEKLYKDVQSYRLVTVATLVDRLKINGSLARKCLKDLEEKGQIKPIVTHSKMKIYSMFTSDVLSLWPKTLSRRRRGTEPRTDAAEQPAPWVAPTK